jgi:putative hydroxymethylpyrimidine transport system ATP-binding protein
MPGRCSAKWAWGDRLHDLPQTLSGGMRQRAALARTLCEDRQIVLMDEPFGHLDAVTRLDLQDLAAHLLQGRTVVMVTHDPLEALRLGHEIRVLSGRPFAVGPVIAPPGSVPRDPRDAELLALQARLIGELRSGA